MSEFPTETGRTRQDALAVLQWIAATAVCAAILIVALGWLAGRIPTGAPAGEATGAVAGTAAGGGAGEPVSFSLPALGGGEIGPADYRGQVVILDFWATWCGPCRLQAEMLEELLEKPGLEGFQILAVNMGEDPATVQGFVDRSPFPYPVVLDQQETLGRTFGIAGLPTVVVLDPDGRVAFHRIGVTDAGTLQAQIESAKTQIESAKS